MLGSILHVTDEPDIEDGVQGVAGTATSPVPTEIQNIGNNILASVAGQAVGAALSSYSPILASASAQTTATTLRAPYSQEMEREADELGFQYLKESGFDLQKGMKIWGRLAMANPSSMAPDFLASHPSLPERFVRMQKMAAEFEIQKNASQTAALQAVLPEDQRGIVPQ